MASPTPKIVSVQEIKSKLMNPALTSHYVCNFEPPNNGFIPSRVDAYPNKIFDRLSLACSEASLPGSTLATHDINNDFTGVSEKHVYRRLYDDRADFSFYVDAEEYYVIKFFEAWIGSAVNEQYGDNNVNVKKRNYTYRVNYQNAYTTDALSITKFERSLGTKNKGKSGVLTYNFVKAFPVNINSIPVSYDSSQLLKCTVSFTYSRYWIESLNLQGVSGEPGQTTAETVPESIYNITPQQQAQINKGFFTKESLSPNQYNFSPGTLSDTFTNPQFSTQPFNTTPLF